MSTGDTPDLLTRLRSLLPPWFPAQGSAPVLDGVLTGIATVFSYIYSIYSFAILQTRIKTATGPFLDLIAWDYLGPTFPRRMSEGDSAFQSRILTFLLLQRVTLRGLAAMLLALTGHNASIIEPSTNCGGWDAYLFGFDASGCWSGNSMLITAFRSSGQGIPNVDGLDGYLGGFDVGSIEWTDISQIGGQVTDAEIALRVRQWVAAGVSYQLTIANPPGAAPFLNFSNIADSQYVALITSYGL